MNDNRIKLIALDLDNTTLNKRSTLSEGNRDAILKAIDLGIVVVVATGRGLSGIPREILEIDGIDYAITSNGSCAYNIRTSERLRHVVMKPEDVETVMDFTSQLGVMYDIFVDGKSYGLDKFVADPAAFGVPEDIASYIHRTRNPVSDINAFIMEHKHEIENFACVTKNPRHNIEVYEAVSSRFTDVYVTPSSALWVEIMNRDCDKGKGLAHLCKLLGISLSEVLACGDADNDVEMLRCAGVGVSMLNGTPKCKEAADFISLSHDEDGVKYALEKFVF